MRSIPETERLIRLSRMGLVNCFLVVEDDGLTLVDAGLFGSSAAILAAAAKLRKSIRRIVLTHAHIDHVGSLDALCKQLPGIEVYVGSREAKLLAGDLSLSPGEKGKPLRGFIHVETRPTQLLEDGERVGSLLVVLSPGHTPGHISFFDTRDGSLIAGDALTTQMEVVVAGAFKPMFPFPAMFSWNRELSTASAQKLRKLNPARLACGHGPTLQNPLAAMDKAIDFAVRQCGKVLN
jgi:glyoxylase-like metal-dependent hydrolase (beta-lactamase superfamily II)